MKNKPHRSLRPVRFAFPTSFFISCSGLLTPNLTRLLQSINRRFTGAHLDLVRVYGVFMACLYRRWSLEGPLVIRGIENRKSLIRSHENLFRSRCPVPYFFKSSLLKRNPNGCRGGICSMMMVMMARMGMASSMPMMPQIEPPSTTTRITMKGCRSTLSPTR